MRILRIIHLASLLLLVCSSAIAQPQYTYKAVASLDSYGGYMEPATIT